MEHIVIPLIGFDDVHFGEDRNTVREAIKLRFGIQCTEYRKGLDSQVTDAFDCFHVYYNKKNKFEAVEFFGDARVVFDGHLIFPCKYEDVPLIIRNLKKDDLGWISIQQSIGIYAPNKRVESILFGEPGYYSDDFI